MLGKEWSVINTTTAGVLNKYELDTTDLKIMKLDEQGSLVWIAEILKHRMGLESRVQIQDTNKFIDKYGMDLSGYDIIMGYRADDSYFSIVKNFIRGTLDYDLIEHCLKLGSRGQQVCIKSERAFSQIKFLGYENVENEVYAKEATRKDRLARETFEDVLVSDLNTRRKTIFSLID